MDVYVTTLCHGHNTHPLLLICSQVLIRIRNVPFLFTNQLAGVNYVFEGGEYLIQEISYLRSKY